MRWPDAAAGGQALALPPLCRRSVAPPLTAGRRAPPCLPQLQRTLTRAPARPCPSLYLSAEHVCGHGALWALHRCRHGHRRHPARAQLPPRHAQLSSCERRRQQPIAAARPSSPLFFSRPFTPQRRRRPRPRQRSWPLLSPAPPPARRRRRPCAHFASLAQIMLRSRHSSHSAAVESWWLVVVAGPNCLNGAEVSAGDSGAAMTGGRGLEPAPIPIPFSLSSAECLRAGQTPLAWGPASPRRPIGVARHGSLR